MSSNAKLALNTILFSSAVITISYLIYKYKIQVFCYGCDDFSGISKDIFNCIVDSSKDSELCMITKTVDKIFSDSVDKITSLSKVVYLELTKHIPEEISAALSKMISSIQDLGKDAYNNMKNMITTVKDFISKAFETIKDNIINTMNAFFDKIIQPIIDFMLKTIIKPFIKALKTVQALADQVSDTIDKFLTGISDEFSKFGNQIAAIFKFIPDKIAWILNEAVDGINIAICGSKVLVDKIVNPIVGAINTFSDGIKVPEWRIYDNNMLNIHIGIPAIPILPGYNKVGGIPWKEGSGLGDEIHDFGDCSAKKEKLRGNLLPNITLAFPNIFGGLIDSVNGIFNSIKDAFKKAWDAFISPINIIVDTILSILRDVVSSVTKLFNWSWAVNFPSIKGIIDQIKSGISNTVEFIKNIIYNNIIQPALDILNSILETVKKGITDSIKKMSDTIDNLIDGLSKLCEKLADGISEFAKYTRKHIFYIVYYYYSAQCNFWIPFNISKTVKIQIVTAILLVAFAVWSQAYTLINLLLTNIQYIIMFCGLIGALIYAMPVKKETMKNESVETMKNERVEKMKNEIIEIMKNESIKNESIKNENIKNESIKNRSIETMKNTMDPDPVENIIINTKYDTKKYPLSKIEKEELISKLKDKYILYKTIEKYENINKDTKDTYKENLIKTLKNKYIEHYENTVLIY